MKAIDRLKSTGVTITFYGRKVMVATNARNTKVAEMVKKIGVEEARKFWHPRRSECTGISKAEWTALVDAEAKAGTVHKAEKKKTETGAKTAKQTPRSGDIEAMAIRRSALITMGETVVEASVTTSGGRTYFVRNVLYRETFGKSTGSHFKPFPVECETAECAGAMMDRYIHKKNASGAVIDDKWDGRYLRGAKYASNQPV